MKKPVCLYSCLISVFLSPQKETRKRITNTLLLARYIVAAGHGLKIWAHSGLAFGGEAHIGLEEVPWPLL